MNTQIHMSASQSEPTNRVPLVSSLPWRADGSDMSLATWVYDANNKRVCTMARCETDWANAEFIAEAVNGHAALVERVARLESALQDAWAYMEHNNIQQFADRQGSVEQTAYCSVRALVKP